MFAQTSIREHLSQTFRYYRENKNLNNMYEDPAQNNEHYVNAPITRPELNNAIASLNIKTSSVGVDILSNELEMLKHLPEYF